MKKRKSLLIGGPLNGQEPPIDPGQNRYYFVIGSKEHCYKRLSGEAFEYLGFFYTRESGLGPCGETLNS